MAVLGLGAMGSRIAARLVDAGHTVTVWNRTPSRAAQFAWTGPIQIARSAREAVAGADVALACVTDDEASLEVWLDPEAGALDAVDPAAVIVESSTISPDTARRLAERAATRGVAFVEAPVVGSRPQAEAGALIALIGGDDDAANRSEPVIAAFAGAIHRVGPVGAGSTLKLAINGLFAAQVAAFAEAAALIERSEVTTSVGYELLDGLPITAPGLRRALGLIRDRQFDPNFPVSLVAKDLAYLVDVSHAKATPLPVATAVASVFAGAADQPDVANLDITGVAALRLPKA